MRYRGLNRSTHLAAAGCPLLHTDVTSRVEAKLNFYLLRRQHHQLHQLFGVSRGETRLLRQVDLEAV